MLEKSASSNVKELGKMFRELLETLKSNVSLACRKEGTKELRRVIETWRLQAHEAILHACIVA